VRRSKRNQNNDIDDVDDVDDGDKVVMKMKVQFTPRYPEEEPVVNVEGVSEKVEEEEIEKMMEKLKQTAQENIGNAMIYNLVCALKEDATALATKISSERAKEEEEEEEEESSSSSGSKGPPSIEDGMKKVKGITPVTRESFLTWWSSFKSECDLKKQQVLIEQMQALGDAPIPLTGRQIFERNLFSDAADDADAGDDIDPTEEDDALFFEYSASSASSSSSSSSTA